MATDIDVPPATKSHARAIALSVTAALILAIIAVYVVAALNQAAQTRRDDCQFAKVFQGYSADQAAELCK